MSKENDEVDAIIDEVAQERHRGKKDISVEFSCFALLLIGLGFFLYFSIPRLTQLH